MPQLGAIEAAMDAWQLQTIKIKANVRWRSKAKSYWNGTYYRIGKIFVILSHDERRLVTSQLYKPWKKFHAAFILFSQLWFYLQKKNLFIFIIFLSSFYYKKHKNDGLSFLKYMGYQYKLKKITNCHIYTRWSYECEISELSWFIWVD